MRFKFRNDAEAIEFAIRLAVFAFLKGFVWGYTWAMRRMNAELNKEEANISTRLRLMLELDEYMREAIMDSSIDADERKRVIEEKIEYINMVSDLME